MREGPARHHPVRTYSWEDLWFLRPAYDPGNHKAKDNECYKAPSCKDHRRKTPKQAIASLRCFPIELNLLLLLMAERIRALDVDFLLVLLDGLGKDSIGCRDGNGPAVYAACRFISVLIEWRDMRKRDIVCSLIEFCAH